MGRVRVMGAAQMISDVLGEQYEMISGRKTSSYAVRSYPFYPSFKMTADEIHPNHPYDGGPFDSRSVEIIFIDDQGQGGNLFDIPSIGMSTGGWTYAGKYRAITTARQIPASVMPTTKTLGPTAWDRFKPGKPEVGLGQAIAELRDIKGLALSRLRTYRDFVDRLRSVGRTGGDNYLAVQFGWRPMIKDMLDWLWSIINIDRQIAELRKQNGKYQRKNGTLFDTDDTSVTTGTTAMIMPSNWLSNHAWTTSTVQRERAWFKGVFRYFIPGLDDPRWGKLRAAQELWDVNITPELVWQLMPWSWLVDWFSNVGDVISNLNSQIYDQVVAKYAYVMYSKEIEYTTTATATRWYNNQWMGPVKYAPVRCSVINKTSSKTRWPASPFGFDFDWSSLTAYQSSILAAFGLGKLRR